MKVLFLIVIPTLAFPCTSFYLKSSRTVAKSYDWHTSSGAWMTNLRGHEKKAFHVNESVNPARWTSRFGSVTLNQYGRDLPNSGMNEKGLVTEVLWLEDSTYPETSILPAINELQWIQYILDTSESVGEAIHAAKVVVVRPIYAKVHYLVCDRQKCATFEYVNGKLVIHTGETLPFPLLTNHTYQKSMEYLGQFEGFGGQKPLPSGAGSLARFVRAAAGLAKFESSEESTPYAFNLLADVAQTDSAWNVVYQQGNRSIALKTQTNPHVRVLNSTTIDYSCRKQSLIADLHRSPPTAGVNALLEPYSRKKNLSYIRKGVANLSMEFPEILIQRLGKYPESFRCIE